MHFNATTLSARPTQPKHRPSPRSPLNPYPTRTSPADVRQLRNCLHVLRDVCGGGGHFDAAGAPYLTPDRRTSPPAAGLGRWRGEERTSGGGAGGDRKAERRARGDGKAERFEAMGKRRSGRRAEKRRGGSGKTRRRLDCGNAAAECEEKALSEA